MKKLAILALVLSSLATPAMSQELLPDLCPASKFSLEQAQLFVEKELRHEDTKFIIYTEQEDVLSVFEETQNILDDYIDSVGIVSSEATVSRNGINGHEAVAFYVDKRLCVVIDVPGGSVERIEKYVAKFH